jgi:hypothetical protein
MNFREFFGGSKPKFITSEVVDPLKKSVATPLSSYLSSEIGQGVPRYTGELSTPAVSDPGLAYGGGSSLSDFLSLDSNAFFNKNVQDPTMENWKKNIAPVIQEGWAGALSGSGRYSDLTASGADLSGTLAKQRGEMALALPAAQYGMTSKMRSQDFANATEIKAQKDAALKMEYMDWMKSLPQYNPALGSALTFLNDATSSGTDVLSAVIPGQQGLFGALLSFVGGFMGGGGSSINIGTESTAKAAA